MVDVMPLVDEGLGNSAYLVGGGGALAVDPTRDLRALRARRSAAAADRVRGGHPSARRLPHRRGGAGRQRRRAGARLGGGEPRVRHTALGDGDEVDLGGLTLRTLSTPGHTHEHCRLRAAGRPSTVGCSPAGRCWSARRPAPTWSHRSSPSSSPGPSTARCSGWPGWTTTSRCGPLTVRARSAPPRPGPSGPRQSAVRRPPTRCCARRPRTRSSTLC